MRCVTGSQCSFKNRMDVVRFLSFTHKPCCCILNFFEVCLVSTEGNLKVKSYNSLSERGQESIQGTYMPDLDTLCGFTRVAYVLRHAEI